MRVRLVVAVATVLVLGMVLAGPASAQYIGGTPPTLAPVVNQVGPAQGGPVAAPVQTGRTSASRVALTGADIAQTVAFAAALVAAGFFLVRQGRRRVVPSI